MDTSFFNFTKYDIPEERSFQITGNRNGEMLIITDESIEDENCKKLFDGIRKAIHSSDGNTCSVLLQNESSMRLVTLPEFHSYKYIIVLGPSPKKLGLNMEYSLFQLKSIGNQRFIFSKNLSELVQNVDFKKSLWSELKAGFILNE